MSQRRLDVVVVGAGPAGLVAAASLARAGRRVVLVDRQAATPPGPLVLGGPAPEVLQALGWLEPLLSLPGVRRSARLRLESEREQLELDGDAELLVVERPAALAEMTAMAAASGVALERGVAASGLLWEGRRVTGVRLRGAGGTERQLLAGVVVDASGPSCWLTTAVGQLLPRRGSRRVRLVGRLGGVSPAQPVLAAAVGSGVLLLPGGDLVATVTCPAEGPPDVDALAGVVRSAVGRDLEARLAAPRVGTQPIVQAGEGWVAVGEAAGSGAPWLPSRTSAGLAIAATAAWEVSLALAEGKAVGGGQLGATLALSRQALRLERLLDRALARAASVGFLTGAAAGPWRRRTLAALLFGSWVPLRGGLGELCYLWWLDLVTRRRRRLGGGRPS